MAIGYPVISGGIGPVVACHFKKTHKTIYRSKPKPYKQTKGTVAAQWSFGMSSTAGKIFRVGLASVLAFPKDKMMQSKFSGAIHKWLKSDPAAGVQSFDETIGLSNFPFNAECGVEKRWRNGITVIKNGDDSLSLNIPAFVPAHNISAPAGTISVECRLAATACDLKNGIATGQFETAFTFPWNNEEIAAREINPGISSKPGNLVVCGAYLIFHLQGTGGKTINNNVKFIPAGVVGVVWG